MSSWCWHNFLTLSKDDHHPVSSVMDGKIYSPRIFLYQNHESWLCRVLSTPSVGTMLDFVSILQWVQSPKHPYACLCMRRHFCDYWKAWWGWKMLDKQQRVLRAAQVYRWGEMMEGCRMGSKREAHGRERVEWEYVIIKTTSELLEVESLLQKLTTWKMFGGLRSLAIISTSMNEFLRGHWMSSFLPQHSYCACFCALFSTDLSY